ncbi:MAG: glutamate racemase [Clostridia bacterium]|nr:glutamate racemase [Clostridia bacterium]
MNNAPIGFLDSGIGGVTVLKPTLELLPCEDYYFFGDSANNPYGDKSDEEIIARCDEIVGMLINGKKCKAVVLACNTASAKAAEHLRQNFTVPIVAIEPAYKMVHDLNPGGFTLVMATRGTIESEKFHRLYYKYNNNKTVLLPCAGLADLIEQNRQEELRAYLENLLGEYKGTAENVVLGCTHYPLAKDIIKDILGEINFFDGAHGVAKRIKAVLTDNDLLSASVNTGTVEFEDSSPDEETRQIKKDRFFELLENY